MPHPLSHNYPISISQLCLENTDVPAGVGAPPLDTTLHCTFAKAAHYLEKTDKAAACSFTVEVTSY